MDHQLLIDVHAHWEDKPPVYRLFVDEDLVTERKFTWKSYEFYIKEKIYCKLDTGIHTLKLENVSKIGRFELDQFAINFKPVNRQFLRIGDNQVEWQFIIDNILRSR